MPNRLADETSPYLRQHRDNPVEWYPWGPEALERARREDRPLLLSIGYAACHWCHVMAHESFEDEQTARLMNERFVNVKVDREERPDLDSIYMNAVQQMTGHGGWPLTAFLLPDGTPFFGGTYYPPEPRHGMPAFRQVLQAVAEAYRTQRAQVQRSAAELRDALAHSTQLRAQPTPLEPELMDRTFMALARHFDARYGGFGSAPKFPQPMTWEFLLRHWKRSGEPRALEMVTHTLRQMAAGGMYDQIGGGFHRYSVDARWLVPHFEKMLYDNALLAQLYLHGYQATGEPEFRRVVEEVLDYLLREMRSPEGGFYSSQDADSEGEEGRFYVWAADELDALLGEDDGALVRAFYGVSGGGNFEGKNILHRPRALAEVAADEAVAPEQLQAALERARGVLYEARARRVWPGRDEKVLTAWNAMTLRALAEAAFVLERDDYRAAALANAELLLGALRPEGRLRRSYKDDVAKIDAFLDDHALLADALLALYETTFDVRWLREARGLVEPMIERFWDDTAGVFYDTAADAEPLVVRPRDLFDNATPSGTSVAITTLQRLAVLSGEARYDALAARALEGVAGLVAQVPTAFGHLLGAVDFYLATPQEVAVVYPSGQAEAARPLLRVLAERYLPNTVRAARAEDDAQAAAAVPLLAERPTQDGRPTAYVCERYACRQPVTEPEALARELEGAPGD